MRNKYQLPHPVRMQVIWLVRDYERMKVEYDNTIWASPGPMDGQPRGNTIGDPTGRAGIKRVDLAKRLEAIEQAFNTVPDEYRQGVWNNIVFSTRYPIYAHRNTYGNHKNRFLYQVARNLYLI